MRFNFFVNIKKFLMKTILKNFSKYYYDPASYSRKIVNPFVLQSFR